jgi:hypothetical protein
MSSVTDFLFEGQPPKAVTEYGQTVETLPKWLSDYTQGIIGKANAIAAEPYQQYQGPRIAGFTPNQLQAFESTKANFGSTQPYIDKAGQAFDNAGAQSAVQAASPYMNTAGGKWTDNYQDYMNPYTQNVLDRQEALATRTLNEKFLPGLKAAFVGNGQFGSTKMLEQGLQGTRDISEGLEQQRLATLNDAYNNGANIFAADAGRASEVARTAGDLAETDANIGLATGEAQARLGEFDALQKLRDNASLESIGEKQQNQGQQSLNLAYSDFQNQRDYPKEQINWMHNLARGLPFNSTTTAQQTGPYSGTYAPSGLFQLASTASSIYGIGQELSGNARGGLISSGFAKGGKVIDSVTTKKLRQTVERMMELSEETKAREMLDASRSFSEDALLYNEALNKLETGEWTDEDLWRELADPNTNTDPFYFMEQMDDVNEPGAYEKMDEYYDWEESHRDDFDYNFDHLDDGAIPLQGSDIPPWLGRGAQEESPLGFIPPRQPKKRTVDDMNQVFMVGDRIVHPGEEITNFRGEKRYFRGIGQKNTQIDGTGSSEGKILVGDTPEGDDMAMMYYPSGYNGTISKPTIKRIKARGGLIQGRGE